MIKLPKKLRNILSVLRKGEIEEGLTDLDKIENFEPQKNLIKSQISYFREEYDKAMDYDEKALPFDDQWYAGNIICEHFFAYSNSAIICDQIERANKFYNNYLEEKIKLYQKDPRINFYKHQISQHIQKIHGERNLLINSNQVEVRDNGEPIEKIIEQYKSIKRKTDLKTKDAIGYIQYFLIANGNTDECLKYYEDNWDSILMEEEHLKVAQLYKAKGLINKAQEVILRFATQYWYPIEHLQIVPMKLWTYEDLLPIISKELKKEILEANKEK